MPRLQKMAHGMSSVSPMGPGMLTGSAKKYPPFNLVISNVPGPKESLYLNGAHLDEVYPVSIPTHYLALNITISGYRDTLGFGYIACRRSVPALQRMLDYTDNAIRELESALGLPSYAPSSSASSAVPKPAAKKRIAKPAAKKPAPVASAAKPKAATVAKKPLPRKPPKPDAGHAASAAPAPRP